MDFGFYNIPSGKHTQSYETWTIEIADLPIQIVITIHSYLSLEGASPNIKHQTLPMRIG